MVISAPALSMFSRAPSPVTPAMMISWGPPRSSSGLWRSWWLWNTFWLFFWPTMKVKVEPLLFTHWFHDMYAYSWYPPWYCFVEGFRSADRWQANLVERDPREQRTIRMQRYHTNEMHRPNHHLRSFLEHSSFMKWFFKVVGVGGVSLLLAGERCLQIMGSWSIHWPAVDGVLTPAQSLLGAIQGYVQLLCYRIDLLTATWPFI
jgi:hypothetical protein